MSIIFGVRKHEGEVVEEGQLRKLARTTDRWAPDGTFARARGRIGMGFQPCHTHHRSNMESQPAVDELGNMVTLDGRIDNRSDLCSLLSIEDVDIADARIVLAAFRRWGDECFSKLVGDWALSLWSQHDRILYLARDHAGTRTLYYKQTDSGVSWSTYIEGLTSETSDLQINEVFALAYMACYPLERNTPYKDICLVDPAHYVAVSDDKTVEHQHWAPFVRKQLFYRTDREYEDHFFHVFRQAVLRRTDVSRIVIAELSGGMDSTAIVSMSDHIANDEGHDGVQRLLNTVSYFRSEEGTWDEKPFFEETERLRGKKGIHIEIPLPQFDLSAAPPCTSLPGADRTTVEREKLFETLIGGSGYRVILSGLGGDELLGGVPTPMPELADYVVRGNPSKLFGASLRWALADRRPLLGMVADAISYAVSLYPYPKHSLPIPPWLLYSKQICLSRDRGLGRGVRSGCMRYSPTAISNALAWLSALQTLPHLFPRQSKRYEFRYPYLDRDLTEFLLAVPRSQIVRPGQRRSLMKRSLARIIPRHILERRRKGYIASGLVRSIQRQSNGIAEYLRKSVLAELNLIDVERLLDCVRGIVTTSDVQWCRQIRATIAMEQWLRSFVHSRLDQYSTVETS
ncbi:asparagine synthase-related protein [Edaphobacter aggregans]|uniref:asparagine synthase-related protein n=1 Tax=Edaphobacter aggregans TaxID=570835 RepID=UPI000558EBBD|nr:asparagine synthase-related protein [Edaphobacter aggregans]